MTYIIDANNLAGKLKMLGEQDFDKKLIAKIKEFNFGKKIKIFLVFDSVDPMGDKLAVDKYISAVYTPRDAHYANADDKIVELIDRSLSYELTGLKNKDEIVVITDDVGLKKRVEKVIEEGGKNISIERVSNFAQRLNRERHRDEKPAFCEIEAKKINDELLEIWARGGK